MSRALAHDEPLGPADRSSQAVPPDPLAPSAVTIRALRREVATLQQEVVELRRQRQRDLATTRGLGEALGALRRGALALRSENEELRRRLDERGLRRR